MVVSPGFGGMAWLWIFPRNPSCVHVHSGRKMMWGLSTAAGELFPYQKEVRAPYLLRLGPDMAAEADLARSERPCALNGLPLWAGRQVLGQLG